MHVKLACLDGKKNLLDSNVPGRYAVPTGSIHRRFEDSQCFFHLQFSFETSVVTAQYRTRYQNSATSLYELKSIDTVCAGNLRLLDKDGKKFEAGENHVKSSLQSVFISRYCYDNGIKDN
jgi:phage gp36-like protein